MLLPPMHFSKIVDFDNIVNFSLVSIQKLVLSWRLIFTVILLPSAKPFKKGCSQLQGKVCAPSTG